MRTQLLCAWAILCGAAIVHAQNGPGNAFNGAEGGNAFSSEPPPAPPMGQGNPNYPDGRGSNRLPAGYPMNPMNYNPAAGVQGYGIQAGPQQSTLLSPPGFIYQGAASYAAAGDTGRKQMLPMGETAPAPTQLDQPRVEVMQPGAPVTMPGTPVAAPGGPFFEEPGPAVQGALADDDPSHIHRPGRELFWITADYSLWYLQQERVSTPLVTTGATNDRPLSGALGQPGTSVLFPVGDSIQFKTFSGIRAEAGMYLDCKSLFSLETDILYVAPQHVTFSKQSDSQGNPITATPFIDSSTGTPAALVFSFPTIVAGGTMVDAKTDMVGAELNAAYHCYATDRFQWNALVGFRFVRLSDSLTLDDNAAPLPGGAVTFQGQPIDFPAKLAIQDSFATANNFYGLQLGTRVAYEGQWINLGAFAKVGIGATEQQVSINGSTTLIDPAAGNTVASGGVLALPSNIGTYNRTVFGIVPEVGLNVAVNLCPHVQLRAGYSFLYWNQVVRAGNQIDPVVNSFAIPTSGAFGSTTATGASRPLFNFNGESFWAQSINVGLGIYF